MINRIVRLSFHPKNVEKFLKVFEDSKRHIAAFPGCNSLSLMRDANDPNVFYTYSLWDNLDALEAYRLSSLFETTWTQTKILFNDKPRAFSLELYETVKS